MALESSRDNRGAHFWRRGNPYADVLIAALICAGLVGLFLIDATQPRGVVDGVGYAAVVACCIRFGKRAVIACAILTTALTLVGAIFVPSSGITLIAMWANRFFAITEIWIVALIISSRRFLIDSVEREQTMLMRQREALVRMAKEAFRSSMSFEDRIRLVTEIAGNTLGVDRVGVYGVQADRERLVGLDVFEVTRGEHRIDTPQLSINTNPEYVDRINQGLVVTADDMEAAPYYAERRELFRGIGIRAITAAGIFLDSQVAGYVSFSIYHRTYKWSDAEISFARSVASVLSLLFLANRNLVTLAALDLVSEGIYIEDRDGRHIYANRVAMDLARERDAAAVLENARFPRPAIPLSGTHDLQEIKFGGRELESQRARLPEGGVVTRVDDVTTRNAVVRERARLESRLRQAARMEAVGQLAGGVAHDFNNILGAVLGFAQLLVQDTPPGSPQRGFAERIINACGRGRNLVEQILTFAKQGGTEHHAIDLATVFARNIEFLATSLPRTTHLMSKYDSGDFVVLGDDTRLSQLVANLCINASDALDGTEGTVRLEMAHVAPARIKELASYAPSITERIIGTINPSLDYICVKVADNGCGMAPETLDRMFEPFFTTKGRQRGTGLGLAVVHGVVETHGGVCLVDSQVGIGTTFSIFLPLAASLTRDEPAEEIVGDLTGNERILIVDDEQDIIDALSMGLSRLGYEAVGVRDPLEALAAFEEDANAWDIVVTDQVMPNMRGIELIRRLKAIRADVLTMICTAYSDSTNERVFLAEGADAFFRKPVDAARIAPRIRTLVGQRASGVK